MHKEEETLIVIVRQSICKRINALQQSDNGEGRGEMHCKSQTMGKEEEKCIVTVIQWRRKRRNALKQSANVEERGEMH